MTATFSILSGFTKTKPLWFDERKTFTSILCSCKPVERIRRTCPLEDHQSLKTDFKDPKKQRSEQCRVVWWGRSKVSVVTALGALHYIGHDCLTGTYVYPSPPPPPLSLSVMGFTYVLHLFLLCVLFPSVPARMPSLSTPPCWSTSPCGIQSTLRRSPHRQRKQSMCTGTYPVRCRMEVSWYHLGVGFWLPLALNGLEVSPEFFLCDVSPCAALPWTKRRRCTRRCGLLRVSSSISRWEGITMCAEDQTTGFDHKILPEHLQTSFPVPTF